MRPDPPPAEELAAAVAGREHWQLDGRAAVYQRPGVVEQVKVQPVAIPDKRTRFAASIIRNGVAQRSRPCYDAAGAIRWAETVTLT